MGSQYCHHICQSGRSALAHVKITRCLSVSFAASLRARSPRTRSCESERTVAFRDINPQAPVHVLVVPREHYPDLAAVAAAGDGLLDEIAAQAHQVAVTEGMADTVTGWSSTPARTPARRSCTCTPRPRRPPDGLAAGLKQAAISAWCGA